MDKKIWILLASCFIIVTIIFIILVIILPILREDGAKTDSKERSTPSKDNILLWANFPGELKTQTTHSFKVFEYSDGREEATIKDSIKLNEETHYDHFEYSDQKIQFNANSTYKIVQDQPSQKNQKIKTISLGLFEMLETLSNPEKYQQGINSIVYLMKKVFQSPETFIKHLFSYDLYKTLKVDDIKNNILKEVDPSKIDKIINGDSEYSLNKALGFDNWIIILGNDTAIENCKWLRELFNLTVKEINSIFGKEKYLYIKCVEFNAQLAKEYQCYDAKVCGTEIIYRQLIEGDVVKINGKSATIYDLYKEISIEYYPFEKSPELFNFFEEYKQKHSEAQDYKDYKLEVKQLSNLLDEKSSITLLSSNHSIFYLAKVASKDFKSLSDKYNINENIVTFICEYIYEFLPQLLIYPSFKNGEENLNVSPLAEAYTNMASQIIKKTYYPLSKLDNLFSKLYSLIFWDKIQKELDNEVMEYNKEDICYLIMQQVLDDGRKALKICGNPATSFKSIYDVGKWYAPYECIITGKTGCDMTVIERLKEIVYVTDDEIKSIYTTHNFGNILNESLFELKDIMQCGDKCFDDKYLIKMQYWKSQVTKNLPWVKDCYTLNEIFPELVPYPMELSYYLKEKGITEYIPEDFIDYLIGLSPEGEFDYLNEENKQAFNNHLTFEKDYTLYINGKGDDKMQNRTHYFNLLNNNFLFDDIINVEYDSIGHLLQGNNNEDKKYLDYLSSGEYYNNFKPGLNKTTGFNFGIDLDTGENIYVPFDKYTIDTNKIRKIININNYSIMNIKKAEYDHVINNYIYVDEPILNNQNLNGDESFTDGFQYNHEDDKIYYYDKISSRIFTFNFNEEIDYNDQICRKYVLVTEDYKPKTASISQKLNKPLYISIGKNGIDVEIKEEISEENYICVEPYSNMVLESKINLLYSLYTKNYGCLYEKIENEKYYPIFVYNKEYKVNINSFNGAFPFINSAKNFKKYFIIIGIIIIVILACCTAFVVYKCVTHKRERISLIPANNDINLINDSREASLRKDLDNN